MLQTSCTYYQQTPYLIKKFWQIHHSNDQKGITWDSYETLSLPKGHGGLGIRNLRLFNQALLAKNDWRLIQNPTKLGHVSFKQNISHSQLKMPKSVEILSTYGQAYFRAMNL